MYEGVDVFFFFFQAEDGIRDYKVTGVQTCALPISKSKPDEVPRPRIGGGLIGVMVASLYGPNCFEIRPISACTERSGEVRWLQSLSCTNRYPWSSFGRNEVGRWTNSHPTAAITTA